MGYPFPKPFPGPTLFASVAFSPLALFAANEPGVWYDPSDLSTMFQDAAGTTPVTAVEQPVGLRLDKSRGLVLGSERITNGDFSSATGWGTGGGAWVISGGVASITAGTGALSQSITTAVAGRTYQVAFTISNYTSGAVRVEFGGVNGVSRSAAGTFTQYITATTTGFFVLSPTSTSTLSVDNISVKELPGSHAFQTTDINRPVLSARYNLLTRTEEFDNAAWVKSNVTVTATTTAAPIGTGTAALVTADVVNATHRIGRIVASSGTNRFAVYVKAGGYDKVGFWDYATTGAYAAFSLSGAGSVLDSGVGASSPSIQALSGGWYLISFSAAGSASTGFAIQILPSSYTTGSVANSWLGDGTSGVYLWGADLRVSNDGVGLPAYQRVTGGTEGSGSGGPGTITYDTVGFPLYLRYNGTNSTMQTASIDFSSTAQMAVFAGVRKLSDANAMICELSINSGSSTGSFGVLPSAYSGSGSSYTANLNGSQRASIEAATFAAPVTNVLTSLLDTAQTARSDEIMVRVNASIPTLTGGGNTNAGTGNFGNYPLYLGARGGSSLWFNGRDYGLCVLGRTATAAEIANMESWLNAKVKAYA